MALLVLKVMSLVNKFMETIRGTDGDVVMLARLKLKLLVKLCSVMVVGNRTNFQSLRLTVRLVDDIEKLAQG